MKPLDQDIFLLKLNVISDRVLISMKKDYRKLPMEINQLVQGELERRAIVDFEPSEEAYSITVISIFTWIKTNRVEALLTLGIALWAGVFGFFVVWLSVYISFQLDGSLRNRIWKLVYWGVFVLFIITIGFGMLLS